MFQFGHRVALQGSVGAGGAQQGEFSAQTVGAELVAQGGALQQQIIRHLQVMDQFFGTHNALAQLGVGGFPLGAERRWIALKGVPAAYHLHPHVEVLRRAHLDRQAKPVQQLGPQFTFFRVAATDENEPRRVSHAQPFALDQVFT